VSRKWGIYGIINLLFKTYFRLNAASLSRNVLRALNASKNHVPSLSTFPKSQQVTFKYYEGVLSFLEENYVEVCMRPVKLSSCKADTAQAEKHLTESWSLCHRNAQKNKE
jgi:COP9 signalosome complex subunit 12